MNKNTEQQDFGGPWTEEKLDCLCRYATEYLAILQAKSQRAYFDTVYLDGFSGSGLRYEKVNQSQTDEPLPLGLVPYEEYKVYAGSPKRILELNPSKFDKYVFVDSNPSSIEKLNTLKGDHSERDIQVVEADCNTYLGHFHTERKSWRNSHPGKSLAALVFLDPYGMSIAFESLRGFRDTHTDLWILIPSGVTVNRLLPLDRKRLPEFRGQLEKFFGVGLDVIDKWFYKTDEVATLFGPEVETAKIKGGSRAIAEFYIQRLSEDGIFRHFSRPLELSCGNLPIYHLLFASNNKTAVRIADYIVGMKR